MKEQFPKQKVTYTITEHDLLAVIQRYLTYKYNKGVKPMFWFDQGDYALILKLDEERA